MPWKKSLTSPSAWCERASEQCFCGHPCSLLAGKGHAQLEMEASSQEQYPFKFPPPRAGLMDRRNNGALLSAWLLSRNLQRGWPIDGSRGLRSAASAVWHVSLSHPLKRQCRSYVSWLSLLLCLSLSILSWHKDSTALPELAPNSVFF